MTKRAVRGFQKVLAENQGKHALIIIHGIIADEKDGNARLITLNDTSHLGVTWQGRKVFYPLEHVGMSGEKLHQFIGCAQPYLLAA